MSDLAYDITCLIESASAEPAVPSRAPIRTPAAVAPSPANAVSAEETLARELLQVADAHEALIQQYLRFSGTVCQGTSRQ
ncbi:hypothetical protein RHOFW104T7_08780 [Rhodanobacter thiooxydans]|uniref:Uncharacterized protein n=1 Tax=Rhodanobacter thiooxydans TaxID=416169 RepID=A0A154QJ94_9GAMM|nr:hypothetical protein [Rhodanobacter thiooxydans]EIM02407.1 hypothetical protein UUA_02106 [Rhodanobacter thiooxydans LCS2]KZC24376.1 hypothetical protein RHOFW104T7_08780 [Rhodanobacter thiooxydans]MCW0201329.1 hypothetical protein [Rhodanobacter thiooxydans]